MKTKITRVLMLLILSQPIFSQSRGIYYTYQNFSSIISDYLPNWNNNNSSTYVIGNEDIVVVTPMIEQNSNYFTMLTRYDKKLCYKGNTKISIPNSPAGYTDIFLNGTSKSDGGFALVSNSYPYIVRNYNNQGGLLFSKKISCPMNPSYFSSGAKILANPYNNNLYVIFEDLEPVANFDPFVNVYGSPVVKVVELSAAGALVNAFKITIPYDTIYPYKNTNIYNIFDFPAGSLIADVSFVKGSPSTIAQDRIWLSLNLDYARSYEIDTTTNQVLGLIINNYLVNHTSYPAILVTNPQGTICSTDIVKTNDNSANAKLAISKDAISSSSATMTLLSIENKQPIFYRFNNHLSSVVSHRFQLPMTFGSPGLINSFGDIKRQDNTLLFSLDKQFGTFDISNTLQVNLRTQNSGNNPSSTPGRINYVKGTTNKLHINMNYLNANNPNRPNHFLIKEDLASFGSTCRSFPNTTFTVPAPAIAESINLVNVKQPLTGIVIANDAYNPIKADDLLIQNLDMCLTCQTYAGKNSLETVGIQETMIVFPNPTHTYFEVSSDAVVQQVEIYSMLGQLVKTYEKQEQYSVADMAKGTYILKITSSEGVLSKTLIVE